MYRISLMMIDSMQFQMHFKNQIKYYRIDFEILEGVNSIVDITYFREKYFPKFIAYKKIICFRISSK